MKLSRDLTHPSAIHAKGLLFVGLGLVSATLILIQLPTLKTAALLGVTCGPFAGFTTISSMCSSATSVGINASQESALHCVFY